MGEMEFLCIEICHVPKSVSIMESLKHHSVD